MREMSEYPLYESSYVKYTIEVFEYNYLSSSRVNRTV